MQIVDIREPAAAPLAVRAVHEAPILVRLPRAFALLAPPTTQGAIQLDRARHRAAGKRYGSAIGSLTRFIAQARPGALPAELAEATDLDFLKGAVLRVRFREPHVESSVLLGGLHQGLLLDGPHRDLFRAIERSFVEAPADPLWLGGANHPAPLCTRCEAAGDSPRPIVDEAEALAFARSRCLPLVLTGPACVGEPAPPPVFGFEAGRVRVLRGGPRLEAIKALVPQRLRSW